MSEQFLKNKFFISAFIFICLVILTLSVMYFNMMKPVSEKFLESAHKHEKNGQAMANGGVNTRKFFADRARLLKLEKKLNEQDKHRIENMFLKAHSEKELKYVMTGMKFLDFEQKEIADKLIYIIDRNESDTLVFFALACLANYETSDENEIDRVFRKLQSLFMQEDFEYKWVLPGVAREFQSERSLDFNKGMLERFNNGYIHSEDEETFLSYLKHSIKKAEKENNRDQE